MPFLILKFAHIGSMFLATALAVGPSVLLSLIARSQDDAAIRRAFARVTDVYRVAGALYGLGILFGSAAALTGDLDLTRSWLVTACVLVGVLIAFNLGFERWTRRIEHALDDASGKSLAEAIGARSPIYTLAAMVTVTLLIVFVMVIKPTLW